MASLAERVAQLALLTFNSLPPKCKPRTLPDGTTEWTPMSAVILAQEGHDAPLACVSLATGTKCLSASALPRCKGLVVHDSHAEILALRGFNRWILSEVEAILRDPAYRSPYLNISHRDDTGKASGCPFRLKDHVTIHFFSTEAPCGDASMEILMDSLPSGNTKPWPVDSSIATLLQGRGYFSLLGHVRRKPARGDAEQSGSKSCTDKIAIKQFTSLLSFPADLFVEKTPNAYVKTVVVYADKYHPGGYQRAFGSRGRLSPLREAGNFFTVAPLPVDFGRFAFDRRLQSSVDSTQTKCKTSNVSAIWVHAADINRRDVVEVLINGVKQGYRQWDERSTKASIVSRKELWVVGARLSGHLENLDIVDDPSGELDRESTGCNTTIRKTLSATTYQEAKLSALRIPHQISKERVTDTLGNWTKNTGDGDWTCGLPDHQIR
ncbi:hypothetical protein Z517_08891 [Fonsecaea pedrosoi CBS 271.37]|uniref:Unplaced genomic scaffold supercont1.5, whole genome shotgun sequence n=1 Tax=Fonsecaea pedrosoi CBS 271.37 TaxID=1442368 RepID=A0A0D2DN06_9EURO|nr:uncharacterized protein Z517_08891 [Fonsecaea pedrosoi CBS 271.37]KIW79051.1 hypothetical protein Z517_08891 [Fonsecaea pedrosoi CBS 271.37]